MIDSRKYYTPHLFGSGLETNDVPMLI